MKNYLPSKKFMVVLALALGALVLIFIILNLIGKKETFRKGQQKGTSLEQLVTLEGIIDKDSDGDGIPDWEEALWGTDPNKKDTDGDGISDYEEIAIRKAALQIELPKSEQELTETEKFSREFFAIVMALKQSGNLSPENIENLASSFSESISSGEIPNIYELKDLLIVSDSQQSEDYYLDQMFEFFTRYSEKNLGGELEIIAVALSESDQSALQELNTIGIEYQNFALEAKDIEVPEEKAILHLSMVNNSAKLAVVILNLVFMLNDPIVGMNAFSLYQRYSEEFVTSVEELTSL